MKTEVYDLLTEYDEGMDAAAKAIREGGLAVFPTETVYGLGADALNDSAVRSIFTAKGRPQDNPLIVHICDVGQAELAASGLSPLAKRVTGAFWPGPFTAVLKKNAAIPDSVSAGLDTVGIRLPSSGYARELIRRSGCMIAAPSANLSGKPSPTKAQHVIEDMAGRVDVILDGGEADYGVESTVCDLTGDVPVILRPGGITAEMIKSVAGDVKISRAVLDRLKDGEKAASPGMKYKHYSPAASVTIVSPLSPSDSEGIAKKLIMLYDKESETGKKPVLICFDDILPMLGGRAAYGLGTDSASAAHAIFDELRRADSEGYDEIFFVETDISGMGLAVMNRMMRAAGFKVLKI